MTSRRANGWRRLWLAALVASCCPACPPGGPGRRRDLGLACPTSRSSVRYGCGTGIADADFVEADARPRALRRGVHADDPGRPGRAGHQGHTTDALPGRRSRPWSRCSRVRDRSGWPGPITAVSTSSCAATARPSTATSPLPAACSARRSRPTSGCRTRHLRQPPGAPARRTRLSLNLTLKNDNDGHRVDYTVLLVRNGRPAVRHRRARASRSACVGQAKQQVTLAQPPSHDHQSTIPGAGGGPGRQVLDVR